VLIGSLPIFTGRIIFGSHRSRVPRPFHEAHWATISDLSALILGTTSSVNWLCRGWAGQDAAYWRGDRLVRSGRLENREHFHEDLVSWIVAELLRAVTSDRVTEWQQRFGMQTQTSPFKEYSSTSLHNGLYRLADQKAFWHRNQCMYFVLCHVWISRAYITRRGLSVRPVSRDCYNCNDCNVSLISVSTPVSDRQEIAYSLNSKKYIFTIGKFKLNVLRSTLSHF
jgi:hypothetical protein